MELPLTPDSKLPPIVGVIEADIPGGLMPLVPAAKQLGCAAIPFLRLPHGDILERRPVGVQFMVLPAALASTVVAPSSPLLLGASVVIGVCAIVAQQIVLLAAHFVTQERGIATGGTILASILTGILLGRTLAGFVAATLPGVKLFGWAFPWR